MFYMLLRFSTNGRVIDDLQCHHTCDIIITNTSYSGNPPCQSTSIVFKMTAFWTWSLMIRQWRLQPLIILCLEFLIIRREKYLSQYIWIRRIPFIYITFCYLLASARDVLRKYSSFIMHNNVVLSHLLLCITSGRTNMIINTRIRWMSVLLSFSWWRHQMEAFSALLALCAGNSPVTGEFPSQRPVTRSFDAFFDLRLNKRLSKQS